MWDIVFLRFYRNNDTIVVPLIIVGPKTVAVITVSPEIPPVAVKVVVKRPPAASPL
jgi:hypothetical protein